MRVRWLGPYLRCQEFSGNFALRCDVVRGPEELLPGSFAMS
jgi:hypothetical protein